MKISPIELITIVICLVFFVVLKLFFYNAPKWVVYVALVAILPVWINGFVARMRSKSGKRK